MEVQETPRDERSGRVPVTVLSITAAVLALVLLCLIA